MAQKCVHKGCGKVFTDPEEPCVYHPGPPEFHEGQKGWKCCKPRFLTFDEFLEIPPCTTGKHSTVDDTPAPEPKPEIKDEDLPPPAAPKPIVVAKTNNAAAVASSSSLAPAAAAVAPPQPPKSPAPAPDLTEESDPEDATIPKGAMCKRRACGQSYDGSTATKREDEECVHHPGFALFHEGSKGWTCCKRRVLEFDEFLKIAGCKKRKRHLFVGQPKDDTKGSSTASATEMLDNIRHDFYQTPTTVMVSLYLKKIDASRAKIEFTGEKEVALDLPTSDGKQRYVASLPLFGSIDTGKSRFKIMGTKLELTLVKKEGNEVSWPVLRSDERVSGDMILQVGRAGRA